MHFRVNGLTMVPTSVGRALMLTAAVVLAVLAAEVSDHINSLYVARALPGRTVPTSSMLW
jgi:hypothetical protein